MGGGASSGDVLAKNEQQIVNLMMPVWFNMEELSDQELGLAASCWNLILNDKSDYFTNVLRKKPDFKHTSCIAYFYDIFYLRLFDVHPMSKSLFKRGIKSQGKFLMRLITLALSEIKDEKKWTQSFEKLAEMHNDIGVKAIEYGVVGEVLFWSIKECIGDVAYSRDTHRVWCKIISRMMQTMLPIAVAFELEHGASVNHRGRLQAHNSLHAESIEESKTKREQSEREEVQ